MKLYETQIANDLFLTLIPLDASNGALWNAYYTSGPREAPYLTPEALRSIRDLIRQEKEASPDKHSATEKAFNSLRAGIAGFKKWDPRAALDHYVLVASYTPLDPKTRDLVNFFEQIEMTMGVYASHHEPLTSHMGIARSLNSLQPGKPRHKGISAYMHAFAAKCMLAAYHGTPVPKTHMTNSPTQVMLYLLLTGLIGKGMGDAVTVEPRRARRPSPQAMETNRLAAEKCAAPGYEMYENDLWSANEYLLWLDERPRDPFPDTRFGRYNDLINTVILARLSALEALADFPHPITTRVV